MMFKNNLALTRKFTHLKGAPKMTKTLKLIDRSIIWCKYATKVEAFYMRIHIYTVVLFFT